jgi:hypothetical protein
MKDPSYRPSRRERKADHVKNYGCACGEKFRGNLEAILKAGWGLYAFTEKCPLCDMRYKRAKLDKAIAKEERRRSKALGR